MSRILDRVLLMALLVILACIAAHELSLVVGGVLAVGLDSVVSALAGGALHGKIMNSPMTASRHLRESGFTFIELMIVIAIMSLLTMVAITNITQQLQQSETASAVRNVYSAWADLSSTAVAADGATLERRGSSLVLVSGATASGTGMQTSWSLPENTNISLNGNTLQCLSLNGDAMPINTSWCPTSLTSSTIPNFWLSVNGGAYVSAKS